MTYSGRTKMNYERFLTPWCKRREPCALRVKSAQLAKCKSKDMIFLAGGYPNAELFPFKETEITLGDGTKLRMTRDEMHAAQQYGPSNGDPELIEFIEKIHRDVHNPPTMNRNSEDDDSSMELMITCGGQEALGKTIDMLVGPGDNVIVEIPTFSGILETLKPTGCNMLTVETDKDGMQPDMLRKVLLPWKPEDSKDATSGIPRVLFTIPNGCNPSGATLTYERKTAIYQIAREYDLIIVEDDPYYFLQYEKLVPSFISIDTDGRVLRLDSFSKILAPGIRLGYLSGPRVFVEKAKMHVMVSSLQPSSLSQRLVLKYLKNLGMDGFKTRMKKIQEFYSKQKDAMTSSLEKWLSDYCEWHEPTAGMFYWVRITCMKDTRDLIDEKAFLKEVMAVHGGIFYPDGNPTSTHFRLSFALCSPKVIDKGIERLACTITEELQSREKKNGI